MKLILASQSPRRCELLRRCGFDFTVKSVPAEELSTAKDIYLLPQENAGRKADAAAALYPSDLIIGADTMIIFEGRAVGKPRCQEDAARILQEFSGKKHDVVTGITLVCAAQHIREVWSEISTVQFKNISDAVIQEYLQKVYVLDKAGAYAIQEFGNMIVADYSGEMENIIGLPLKKLQRRLQYLLKQ